MSTNVGKVLLSQDVLESLAVAHGTPPGRQGGIAAQSYWRLAGRELSAQNFMATHNLSHACEYETSMMLTIRNDWVKMEKAGGGSSKKRFRIL